eukprot:764569_1
MSSFIWIWGTVHHCVEEVVLTKPVLLDVVEGSIRHIAGGDRHVDFVNVSGELYNWGEAIDGSIPSKQLENYTSLGLHRVAVHMRRSLKMRDHRSRLRLQRKCFSGREAADWIIINEHCVDQDEALTVGNFLLRERVFYSIRETIKDFRNDSSLYRFDEDNYRNSFDDSDYTQSFSRVQFADNLILRQVISSSVSQYAVTDTGELHTWTRSFRSNGHTDSVVSMNGDPYPERDLICRPQPFTELLSVSVTQVACGDHITAILSDSGAVYTWGSTANGRLGHGPLSTNQSTQVPDLVMSPTRVEGLSDVVVTELACGWNHCAVITNSGALYTWGCGLQGRLGLGADVSDRWTPELVTCASDPIVRVACGYQHTLLIDVSGSVYACGSNSLGQLGIGDELSASTPSKVCCSEDEMFQAVFLSCGAFHSSVITATGDVFMWGDNSCGQLGDGTTRSVDVPTILSLLSGLDTSLVYCAGTFSMAVTANYLSEFDCLQD